MKGMLRNPVPSSCHFSGVARSDSKLSAKALYGKWLHGSRLRCCAVCSWKIILLFACFQNFVATCPYFCGMTHSRLATVYSLSLKSLDTLTCRGIRCLVLRICLLSCKNLLLKIDPKCSILFFTLLGLLKNETIDLWPIFKDLQL